MSALPASIKGNGGPMYTIPTVKCIVNPDALGTGHRLSRTTNNIAGIISQFLCMYKRTIQYTTIYCVLSQLILQSNHYMQKLLFITFRKT